MASQGLQNATALIEPAVAGDGLALVLKVSEVCTGDHVQETLVALAQSGATMLDIIARLTGTPAAYWMSTLTVAAHNGRTC